MGIISTGPGSPLAFSSASGGKVIQVTGLDTTPVPVVGVNPSRQKLTFHNPGTIDAYIAPSLQLHLGSSIPMVVGVGNLGGCFLVYANGGTLVIEGECQGAWQAFSASGSGNPLTVMDSNV